MRKIKCSRSVKQIEHRGEISWIFFFLYSLDFIFLFRICFVYFQVGFKRIISEIDYKCCMLKII